MGGNLDFSMSCACINWLQHFNLQKNLLQTEEQLKTILKNAGLYIQ